MSEKLGYIVVYSSDETYGCLDDSPEITHERIGPPYICGVFPTYESARCAVRKHQRRDEAPGGSYCDYGIFRVRPMQGKP